MTKEEYQQMRLDKFRGMFLEDRVAYIANEYCGDSGADAETIALDCWALVQRAQEEK